MGSFQQRTSRTIELTGRDRSLPRVKGTMQKEHMLLQPRMTDTNAVTEFFAIRTGETSAYVSSRDKRVLIPV
jgi:hypothetical protein